MGVCAMYQELEHKITSLEQAISNLTKRYETQLHQKEMSRCPNTLINRTSKLHAFPHSL